MATAKKEPAAAPAKKTAVKTAKFKIPKSLGDCADLLKQVQETRLAEQKKLEVYAEQERALRNHIIDNLPKSQLGGVAGKKYRAEIKTKTVITVEDWGKLQAHIKKTGDFDLLGRSINQKAVEARLEAKKKVPGTGTMNIVSLSITKL